MSNKLSLTLCKNKELKTHIDTFFIQGKRNGKGVLYYDAIGSTYYDGEWKDNQKNGFGLRRYN